MTNTFFELLHKSSNYKKKSQPVQQLIADALTILNDLGIPVDNTPRRLERMSMSFLAVANVVHQTDWPKITIKSQKHTVKSRDIIEFINQHFEENISRGSYDDIRRKDLQLLILSDIVLPTAPDTARNNPNRAYMINPVFAKLIQYYATEHWPQALDSFFRNRKTLAQQLSTNRQINMLQVIIPSGQILNFEHGEHNQLQKMIIELFLPRFGYGAELLYVGDAVDKFLLLESQKLQALNFFELRHGELPDVIAYSASRNWLYLIEAVHSSGCITPMRLLTLKNLTMQCTAEIIYITAFHNRSTFRKFVADIAWETEVWIADDPDHLIHFNGDKFLGPYKPK